MIVLGAAADSAKATMHTIHIPDVPHRRHGH